MVFVSLCRSRFGIDSFNTHLSHETLHAFSIHRLLQLTCQYAGHQT